MTQPDLIDHAVRLSESDAVFRAIALCDPVAAVARIARDHGLVLNAARADTIAFVASAEDAGEAPDGSIVVVLPRPLLSTENT